MTIAALITTALLLPSIANGNIQHGWASHYMPAPMQATIAVRQGWGQIPHDLTPWVGFVARPLCDEIGDTVYLRPSDSLQPFAPFLVVDCAVTDDSDGALSWMRDNNILVEVDYDTAVRWGSVGGGIRVDMMMTVKDRTKW